MQPTTKIKNPTLCRREVQNQSITFLHTTIMFCSDVRRVYYVLIFTVVYIVHGVIHIVIFVGLYNFHHEIFKCICFNWFDVYSLSRNINFYKGVINRTVGVAFVL